LAAGTLSAAFPRASVTIFDLFFEDSQSTRSPEDLRAPRTASVSHRKEPTSGVKLADPAWVKTVFDGLHR
jgi:hypothetical protein